ncbi:T9SS type A sorting domain-containing protein [Kaistella palustris]|uniref:T9SS type A sorting domain-containing protein n=1 Tax=Kaistella palustris TaxID=493376 RepID=UPI00040E3ADB|nr:T9SS type A sorting domain-containing protein [Kaistella palustris]
MKKIYSLFAAVALAATVSAQTTVFSATFDDVNGTGGNDGAWSGSAANTAATAPADWVYSNMYKGDQCLKGGTGSKLGSITTPALTELSGVATLTFRAGAWDGASEKLTLNVDIIGGGTLDMTTVTMVKGAFTTYTIQITGGTSTSKLVFAAAVAANNRFFIDDIVVKAPTQAVGNVNAAKVNLVKNTVVGNSILFADKADIKVINTNGQVVKTASVNQNTALDVATLPKGMYIVTAVVNGNKISQKIMKK